jgi:sirohydrochlorin cobaltochelatase
MTQGLILFAHGARDAGWAAPFEAVAARIRRVRPALPLCLAFLEFMHPDLLDAGGQLAGQGCDGVDVLPLFLGSGAHLRRDLPLLIEQLRAAHPQVRWTAHAAAGEQAQVVEALAQVAIGLHAPFGEGGTT